MEKEKLFKEVKKLSKKEKRELKKQLPKIKKTKEQIELRQVKRKARCENICIFLITIFFLGMAVAGVYMAYLMLTSKWWC